MSAVTWGTLAGNTSRFAVELSFIDDDDTAPVDLDERASWGSFSLWVHGRNLCAHSEQGEQLRAAHWYLLPLLEWLAVSWDALLHEHRLLLPESGPDAAQGARRAAAAAELAQGDDQSQRMERWYGWYERHNLRAASSGGLFPDIYLRRYYGDDVELSVGGDAQAGTPSHFAWSTGPASFLLPMRDVAEPLREALEAATQQLSRRRPESVRLKVLRELVASLDDGVGRRDERLAMLSGAQEDHGDLRRLLSEAGLNDSADLHQHSASDRSLAMSAPAYALLFGTLSPALREPDVRALLHILQDCQGDQDAAGRLEAARPTADTSGMSPGESGSLLGDESYEAFADAKERGGLVDVPQILGELRVEVEGIELEDTSVRGISVLKPSGCAVILVNSRYARGQSQEVVRFTLAHELAHLLLDRARARELVIASGPWAPLAVEQRANAFAAAFLMPARLVLRELAVLTQPISEPEPILRMAAALRVSKSALVERLYNLGQLTREQADRLRYTWPVGIIPSGNAST